MVNKIFQHEFVDLPKLIQVNEESGERKYRLPDGREYPSVTTVLNRLPKAELAKWRKRVGEKEADRIGSDARGRGKGVHSVIESYLLNKPVEIESPVIRSLFNKIRATLDCIDKIKLLEGTLYSDRIKMAGTADCIGEYGGVLSTLDFKGSTKIKQEKYIQGYFAQCGAYSIMYEELFGVLPEQCVVLIAVEEAVVPQVFKKSTDECFHILTEYVKELNTYLASTKEVK